MFFPNLNHSDSAILYVASPCLVFWRFRNLVNRMDSQCMKGSNEKGEACSSRGKNMKTSKLSSLTLAYRLCLWLTHILPFFDQRRLLKLTLMPVGSQCYYTDLLHLIPTRTESKTPFLSPRSCWPEARCFSSYNQSIGRLMAHYPPGTNGIGSRWCTPFHWPQSDWPWKETESHFAASQPSF